MESSSLVQSSSSVAISSSLVSSSSLAASSSSSLDVSSSSGGSSSSVDSSLPLCVYPVGALGRGLSATACVRLSDGTAACGVADQGSTSFTQMTAGGNAINDVQIAGGSGYYGNASIVTSDGTIYTGQFFGTNEISAPENGRVTFAATGQNRRCAMTEHNGTHKVYCGSDSQAPDTQVTGLPDERMISMDVGYGDGCVLTESRTAYCWTTSGGYVTPKNVAAYTAVEIPLPKDNAAFISVSEYRACVAYEDDDASCFAESQDYSIGLGSFSGIKIVDIAGGKDHTCFLDDQGQTYCASAREDIPSLVGSLPKYKDLSAGWNSWVCGVTEQDDVECFSHTNPASTTAINIGGKAQAAECRD